MEKLYNIKQANSFNVLLKSDAKIFFLDIEETILCPNIYYDLLGNKNYMNLFFNISKDEKDVKISDLIYFGRNHKRKLTESGIPAIISQLRNEEKMVFALTSGSPSRQKKDRIREFGINLNGYLFTRGADKGPFLVNFIIKNKLEGHRCAFVDNHESKILNVAAAYRNSFSGGDDLNDIECFHYNKRYNQTVNKLGFINYWKSVINAIKKGQLEKLRERIKKEVEGKKSRNMVKAEMIEEKFEIE